MSQSTVKEIMIPCSELSSISADASLGEAILALGEVVDAFRHGGRSSRVLLVTDSTGRMVGKLTPVDILRGMPIVWHMGQTMPALAACTALSTAALRRNAGTHCPGIQRAAFPVR